MFSVDGVGIVDEPVGVGEGDGSSSQFDELLDRELRHVPAARDEAGLALQDVPPGGQHLAGEVHDAVPGGFLADMGATPFDPFSGERAHETLGDALVLSEEIADLALAHPDVSGGHVGELSDVGVELGHERLAEPADLRFAPPLRVEVRTPLGPAHRQGGQGVLQGLLEGQELEEARAHRRMESQPALVGADRTAHLDPVTTVDVDLAGVVHPVDAEADHPIGLDEPLEDLVLDVAGVAGEHRLERADDLPDRLMEVELTGILGHDLGHHFVELVLRPGGRLPGPG